MSKEHYLTLFQYLCKEKQAQCFQLNFKWWTSWLSPGGNIKYLKGSHIISEELIGQFISWLTELFQLYKDQILFIVLQRAHINLHHLSFTWAALAWRRFAHKWKQYIPCLDDELWHIEIILLWTIKCWDNVRPGVPRAGGLCPLLRT